MTQKVLVTGGAGFIGSHAVDRFLSLGADVRVVDNLATGDLSNLAAVRDRIDFREVDLRDLDTMRDATEGVDVVVHLAALGSVPRSFADPLSTHEVNATGTLNTLLASRDAGVQRVVFASSSSVFGSNRAMPKSEEMLGNPLSPYAATKRIGEDYCVQFFKHFGLDTVVLRFFNVFGPRQMANHVYAAVIPKFIDATLRGEPIEVHGDGLQSRDFTFVGNAVDGIMGLTDLSKEGLGGETFHLACGVSVSLLDVVKELEQLLGRQIERHHVEPRPGDIRDSLADISKLRAAIGYEPQVSVPEGLAATTQWFQSLR